MGIPRVPQMDNEMSASGGGRYRHILSHTIPAWARLSNGLTGLDWLDTLISGL
jgi:hypothetical protein